MEREDKEVYQTPIYKTPPRTQYDEPRYHQPISDTVDAHGIVGAGTYAIGARNHVPCVSRPKESGAAQNNLSSALKPFYGKQ